MADVMVAKCGSPRLGNAKGPTTELATSCSASAAVTSDVPMLSHSLKPRFYRLRLQISLDETRQSPLL